MNPHFLKGVRNSPISFRTTKDFKQEIKKALEVYTRPDPSNPRQHIKFKSEREFFEILIMAVLKMPLGFYKPWIEFFNPDHPEDYNG